MFNLFGLFKRKPRIIPFPANVYGQPEADNEQAEAPSVKTGCKIISFEYRNLEFDHHVDWPTFPKRRPGRYKLFFIWDYL